MLTFLKPLHVIFALVSVCGFMLRGYWMMRDSPLLYRRWVKITPHAVDTLLLLTGLTMMFAFGLYPTAQPWLATKLVAVIVYIVLGSIALKRGKTRAGRTIAFVAAISVFVYIVAVAVQHSPTPLPT